MLLGLDIGTTKVAAVLADASGAPVAVASAAHGTVRNAAALVDGPA
jgi:sugar (pentulose or hexulose) kinase